MVKRASSKKAKKGRKKSTKVVYHSTKEIKVERALIENFIGLQQVMINLSSKFESLSSQISRLLNLFEVSARTLAKRESSSGDMEAKKILDKLENISRQAGLIGKGLALIHEVRAGNERPIIPINPNAVKTQIPSSTGFSPLSPNINAPVHQGVPFTGLPQQKMTREVGLEFEKAAAAKQRKLGEDTNAGTNA